ncbi:HU family DNA-binding protein [uncultured Friedmanniella sp.]|uniref:HU family DNA-binding protein n=1 Tax=uncultured Friedmanniella sp. TaxID=335381 RepID=UPI0035CC851D
MNKTELIEALASHFDGSRAEATRALNAFVHTISSATAAGDRVAITGFGVFEKIDRPARTVRNPRTGERLDVAATAVPRFRAGTELKAYVSGARPVPELAPVSIPRRTAPAAVAEPVAPAAEPDSEPTPVTEKVKGVAKAASKKAASKKDAAKLDVKKKDAKKKDSGKKGKKK